MLLVDIHMHQSQVHAYMGTWIKDEGFVEDRTTVSNFLSLYDYAKEQ